MRNTAATAVTAATVALVAAVTGGCGTGAGRRRPTATPRRSGPRRGGGARPAPEPAGGGGC
ncbi:hypothetical protein ACFCY2_40145, partial [Streptomyces noursei]